MEIKTTDVELYRRYDGDVDGLSRSTDRESNVSDVVWRKIDDLRQNAFIVKSGQASGGFSERFEDELSNCNFENGALEEFWRMVAADIQLAKSNGR